MSMASFVIGGRNNFKMTHACIQVQHTRNIFGVFDSEIGHIVQPILTETVPILHGNRQRIFLTAEQTIQLKLDFNFLTWLKVPELGALQASICSKNIHADAIADEDADHRVGDRLVKSGADAEDDGFSRAESAAAFARGVEYLHVD